MMQKDYNVTVKVRNARILNALAKVDEKAGGKLAKKLGVPYQQMLDLINLKIEPVDKHGDWLPSVLKLAELTHTMPVDLFSDAQYYPLDVNVAQFEMGQEEVMHLLHESHAPDPYEAIEQQEMQQAIEYAIDTLTPREAEVIRLRFGIDGREHSMEQVAQLHNVTRERVRQIEAKALRKLRHPSRAIPLAKTHDPDWAKKQEEEKRKQDELNKIYADQLAAELDEAYLEKRKEAQARREAEALRTMWQPENTQPKKDGLYERRVKGHYAYCLYLDGKWLIGDKKIMIALTEILEKRPSTYTNTEWREIPKKAISATAARAIERTMNSIERKNDD